MGTWSDLELPPPQAPGYGYTVDSGLVRTQFATAHPLQRQDYTTGKRTFTISVQLTQAQLKLATNYLEVSGFTWFSMDLLSGQSDSEIVSSHCVRLTKDYSVSALGYDLYTLSAEVEQLVERSIIVTSQMYPMDVVDDMGQTAPADFSYTSYQTKWDEYIGQTAPAPFSISNVQTVFWNYINASYGSGAAHLDTEEIGQTAPAIFSTTIEQTVFNKLIAVDVGAYHSDREEIGQTAPAIFSTTVEQTVWWLYLTTTVEEMGQTAPAPFAITIEAA